MLIYIIKMTYFCLLFKWIHIEIILLLVRKFICIIFMCICMSMTIMYNFKEQCTVPKNRLSVELFIFKNVIWHLRLILRYQCIEIPYLHQNYYLDQICICLPKVETNKKYPHKHTRAHMHFSFVKICEGCQLCEIGISILFQFLL